ncbi:CPBP family intramembrane glutamic endopeptidase [Flavobacterium sp. ZS1P14]|uniref:CPBP family intramembrane glutamic endopeptidase n=1 Tax=Flavobacterium sp. ZS1P14 TaxID=3401729 RepID=UPI003AAE0090
MPLKDIGLIADNGSLLRFLSGLGIGMLMVFIQALIVTNFADVKFYLASHNQPVNIITSLILYFLVACREELAFRSYSLRSMAYSLKPPVALAIITVIFVMEHVIAGMSWKMSILRSGLGGILFGLAALKTRGLALPLGLYFSWNFNQCLLGFKNNTGVWREIVEKGQESQAENIALTGFALVMSVSIVGILLFYRKKKN